jgi:hypothetical protein
VFPVLRLWRQHSNGCHVGELALIRDPSVTTADGGQADRIRTAPRHFFAGRWCLVLGVAVALGATGRVAPACPRAAATWNFVPVAAAFVVGPGRDRSRAAGARQSEQRRSEA